MKMHWRRLCGVFLLGMVFGSPTYANDDDGIEEIVVRAHPLSAEGLAQPVSVVESDELQRTVGQSLGETLNSISGIHSSSFGQAVGRPVIRGLGGPRVKTMEDRIDSLDVSVSSPDHVVSIETFIADGIEVLKGPSTLLYGTGAIGGVVDVHTGRIPHEVPEKGSLVLDARGADNGDRRTSAGRFDFGAGNFAFHFDGFYREADEYEIPGFAESSLFRRLEELEEEEHEGEEEEHEHEEEEARGELPGSQFRTKGGAFGMSHVTERGFVGISVSRYEADYGLPGGHGHEEEHEEGEEEEEEHEEEEEGNPNLELEQTRVDLEAGIADPFAGFSSFNFRLGINDYEHTEVEGSGEIGTTFETEAWEGRMELTHEPVGGVSGSFGIQVSQREFSAIGEEAFVMPVDTDTVGVFYVGQANVGDFNLEAGLRLEQVDHSPTANRSRDFDLYAASFGLIRPIGDNWVFTAQLDRSTRAPVAEELYSDGPHLATNSFEIGDPNLDEEEATNLAVSLQYDNDTVNVLISAYRTDFSDYIYEAPTGDEEDELPVFLWQQNDADFTGLEADFGWKAAEWDQGSFSLNVGVDIVDVDLSGAATSDLPRIPPRRYRLGFGLEHQNFIARLVYTDVDDQDDVGLEELPTDGYENVSAYLGYRFDVGESNVEIFLRGENLTDDEQRYHTSFIKDLAPQPGRTIEGGIRVNI